MGRVKSCTLIVALGCDGGDVWFGRLHAVACMLVLPCSTRQVLLKHVDICVKEQQLILLVSTCCMGVCCRLYWLLDGLRQQRYRVYVSAWLRSNW